MPAPTPYVEVAVTLPVDHTFTYSVPHELLSSVAIGKRVLVPFGRRRVTGFILELRAFSELKEIRPLLEIIDKSPLFPEALIPFYKWIADYYQHPIGQVVKSALPGGLNVYEITQAAITAQGLEILESQAVSNLKIDILAALRESPLALSALRQRVAQRFSRTTVETMARAGWIDLQQKLRGGRTRSKTEGFVRLLARENDNHDALDKLSSLKKELLAHLKTQGELSVRNLKTIFPTAGYHLKALERSGHVCRFNRKVYRDPFGESIEFSVQPVLTKEQTRVVDQVTASLGKGFATYLLAGVTGSGKTEVYLQIAAEAVRQGLNVLVLVPEIALISQMERHFRARFGERVAVLHSGLSDGERFDQWQRILEREVPIAIGARSAIFAPFDAIGVIIVDEEHDTSYKQEGALCYNARDLAVVRAKQHNGIALLGSATPSIQSYYNVMVNKYTSLRLTKRIEQRQLPEITVVDLRTSHDARGFRRIISQQLYNALQSTLASGDQALLFLNRRGYASYPVCSACGAAIKCDNCDISLTLHQAAKVYKCHYCGFQRASLSNCTVCGSPQIKNLGLGTEKIEDLIHTLFPEARVARMDGDTTARKGALLKLLKGLRRRTIDIMVGTQMVAKGHDFPHITLVGILCADLSLNFPDFRAGERTFQLLAQVAGRAGRGDTPGRVILQTYNPEHFSIAAAQQQDFEAFYQHELKFRQELNYPPFTRMIQIRLSGKDRITTQKQAQWFGDQCRALCRSTRAFDKAVEILGPIEAPLSRIAGYYRWQILLKGHPFKALHRFTRLLMTENQVLLRNRNVRVAIDVDPYFMM